MSAQQLRWGYWPLGNRSLRCSTSCVPTVVATGRWLDKRKTASPTLRHRGSIIGEDCRAPSYFLPLPPAPSLQSSATFRSPTA